MSTGHWYYTVCVNIIVSNTWQKESVFGEATYVFVIYIWLQCSYYK